MNTKLTLTIEKKVIKTAKEYAKEKGQSLSDLVENYFKLITRGRREILPEQLSPRIQRLRGIMTIDHDFDYKEVLSFIKLKMSPKKVNQIHYNTDSNSG